MTDDGPPSIGRHATPSLRAEIERLHNALLEAGAQGIAGIKENLARARAALGATGEWLGSALTGILDSLPGCWLLWWVMCRGTLFLHLCLPPGVLGGELATR